MDTADAAHDKAILDGARAPPPKAGLAGEGAVEHTLNGIYCPGGTDVQDSL